jgi:hypothetical protein
LGGWPSNSAISMAIVIIANITILFNVFPTFFQKIFIINLRASSWQEISKTKMKISKIQCKNQKWIPQQVRNDRCGINSIRCQISRLRFATLEMTPGCEMSVYAAFLPEAPQKRRVGASRDEHRTIKRRSVRAGVNRENANRR